MNILITGGNRGLGFQKVKDLLKINPKYNIYITVRKEENFIVCQEKLKKLNLNFESLKHFVVDLDYPN